jgi:chromosome segregation ATPase
MAEEPTWLTVIEAARRLGVTPQAVRARIKRGTLEKRLDNRGNVLVALSEEREQPATTPPDSRDQEFLALREQVARLEERVVAAEAAKGELRRELGEVKDRERRLLAMLDEALAERREPERRPWPGLKAWWRRVWAGEGSSS